MNSGSDTPKNKIDQSGFALLILLLFLMICMLFLASMMVLSQDTVSLTAESVSAARLRSALTSGIDYAESELRSMDFDDVLSGLNHSPDVDAQTARSISFRNPISRAHMTETDWKELSYTGADDGLLYADGGILSKEGLALNECRLFFKVTNNPDDPGGPFHDTDDSVIVRVAGVTPLPVGFLSFRKVRNISEIVEVQFRRNATFLGPAAVYSPTGGLILTLSENGLLDGLAEVSTGAAIASALPPETNLNALGQLRGNPPLMDISILIQNDSRMRWLADPAFVEHWKQRIPDYAAAQSVVDNAPRTYWFPAGLELSGDSNARGIAFSAGSFRLSGAAVLEGLLILLDSAPLEMRQDSRIRGGVVVVGDGRSQMTLEGRARIEYAPGCITSAIKLLPLSRSRFRYILPDMQ